MPHSVLIADTIFATLRMRINNLRARVVLIALVALVVEACLVALGHVAIGLMWALAAFSASSIDHWLNCHVARKGSRRTGFEDFLVHVSMTGHAFVLASAAPMLWFLGDEHTQIVAMVFLCACALQVVMTNFIDRGLFLVTLTPYALALLVLPLFHIFELSGEFHPIGFSIPATSMLYLCFIGVAFFHLNGRHMEAQRQARRANVLRRQAEEANASKSEFLAMTSHELRTPMHAMLGSAEVLRRTDLSSEQREHLETLLHGGEVLMALLNDILDVAKIEAGKLQVERMAVDLIGLVEGVERLWRPKACDKGLTLVLDMSPDLPKVIEADPTRLRQVIFNLLSNALKFTERGEVRLKVSGHCSGGNAGEPAGSADGAWTLRIDVIDQGCGMDAQTLGKLFAAFEQANASIARKHGGSGLGLSICRSLVHLLGGTITVNSELGRGSTFSVFLPTRALREHVLENEADVIGELTGRPLHVLIAEDHPVNRRIIGALLQPLGFELIMATNGAEAVAMFELDTFDVVLMDMQMPVMDGLEATRRIRAASEHGRTVPIIALTANAGDAYRKTCQAAGMSDFVSKPVDLRALHAAIARGVRRSRAIAIGLQADQNQAA